MASATGIAATAGTLASRLASHALASCSLSAANTVSGLQGLRLDQRRSSAAAAASDNNNDTSAAPAAKPFLTPAQKQQLPRLLALLQRPGSAAQRLGSLASACVTSRDLAVAMTSLHLRQHGFTQPLLVTDEEYTARVPTVAPSTPRGSFLPLKDTTLDDDSVTVAGRPAPPEQPLEQRYMDRATAWAQTLPNHIEMSYPLLTGIKLFPPQEATYPTYVDFDAATRLLRHRQSRRKLRLARRLARKQDKYQLKTWDHYVGEA